jgi:hypothetical protein
MSGQSLGLRAAGAACLVFVCCGGATGQPCTWSDRTLGPGYRSYHAMAYDSVRRRTVLFGGIDIDYNAETWEWDGTSWTLRATTGPSGRQGHAMAFDQARAVTVLFGGDAGGFPSAQTYEWNGTTWTLRATSGNPGPRVAHGLAYDSARQEVVMFGGYNFTGYVRRTHAYDGSSWQLRDQGGPTERGYFSMSYDSARSVTVLVGGDDAPDINSDTWEWTGTAWIAAAYYGVTPRYLHAGAFDAARARTVVFGGIDIAGAVGTTYEWNGVDWVLRATAGVDPSPSARYAHAMAYDSFRNVTVLYGGDTGSNSGQTWEWNGTTWTLRHDVGPSPRSYHAMVYDAARGHTFLFGGETGDFNGETWSWNGVGWSPLATPGPGTPSPREGHAMAYDSARAVVVLFGGIDNSGANGQTWEWNGTSWTLRAASGPPPRSFTAMAYDSQRGVCVLFAGQSASGGFLGDTWEWSGQGAGSWTQRAVGSGPPPRAFHGLAYDPARRVTVLFGGGDQSAYLADTWEWDGAAWTQRPHAGPSGRTFHSLTFDGTGTGSGAVVVFGGDDAVGYNRQTWQYNGVEWLLRSTGGPAASDGSAMAFDAGRQRLVHFGGYGSGYLGSIFEWQPGPPAITQQPAAAVVASGQTATLTAAAGEPASFRWRRNRQFLVDDGRISGAASATLTINNFGAADQGSYDVFVYTPCGNSISLAATLSLAGSCTADWDHDGNVTPADVASYVNTWFSNLTSGGLGADLNGDGTITPADVALFVQTWFAAATTGC